MAGRPARVKPLVDRLNENADALLAAYRASAAALERGRSVEPAAEWLLDNYHVVETQIRQIRTDLPSGYYRKLPKLADGPLVGYPRVFGLAWAIVAHTDSHFDPEVLRRFVMAYQRVEPLSIGELWAVAISLRLVLVENLRRVAAEIAETRSLTTTADELIDRIVGPADLPARPLEEMLAPFAQGPLPIVVAAQLAKRLRDQDPDATPARQWLERKLSQQDSSIEEVVRQSQQSQGAANVTVRNVITSMRLISDTDWSELFEAVSLVDEHLRRDSTFALMDFPTRDLYRNAIETLARGSRMSEIDVAERALALADAPPPAIVSRPDTARIRHVGYYLIADGRYELEDRIGFRAPVWRKLAPGSTRLRLGLYVGGTVGVAALLVGFVLLALDLAPLAIWAFALLTAAGLIPALHAVGAVINRAIITVCGTRRLAGLELASGIPPELRTLIAVPTLLGGERDLLEQVEGLEVHYLANPGGAVHFALLTDGFDARTETTEGEAGVLARAAEAIAQLNRKYGAVGEAGPRFFLLHRHSTFNASEDRWMGWERKRGKLHELNRLLRGATDTGFVTADGRSPEVPAGVRYVLTLDADTRLPRGVAARLVGKMAHPLNAPQFDEEARRVVEGYGILQPRVTPSLPIGHEGSLYQGLFSSPGGIDIYAGAVSDIYQDLFGEGSFTGKGIYDVDAFEAAMAGRVPPNTLLSHDLFEGIFARAGLASDVEVVEDFPARYDVAARRQHRWVRGDWQLLPWILGRGRKENGGVPSVGLGKMLDNLRRSLLSPMVLAALLCGWLLPMPASLGWTIFVVAATVAPGLVPIPFAMLSRRAGITSASHLQALAGDLRRAAGQSILQVVFLSDDAYRMGDAITRTLFRLYVTHRHLLEWTTAAQTGQKPRLDLLGFYRGMAGGLLLAAAVCSIALALAPMSWPLVAPFALLWAAAPAVALRISRSPPSETVTDADADELRLVARRTWRYFETFVTPDDNMLPPDNFQEDPKPVVAHRTSPTNLGLYLLATVTARDFGWSGQMETIERLETTLAAMKKLRRFRGHFFNWYDTKDLRVLDPAYVSSVDSGNLFGHLIALANACGERKDPPLDVAGIWPGLADTLALAREAMGTAGPDGRGASRPCAAALDQAAALLSPPPQDAAAFTARIGALRPLVGKAARLAADAVQDRAGEHGGDLVFWTGALERLVAEHERDLLHRADAPRSVRRRLDGIAATAREMAMAMDFTFLLDPQRKLLSIGYSAADSSLDPSCYDLLASEARLASLCAIAKGDVPTKHWFRLGRTATPVARGSALISWSGSMFEYLMPSLVMRAPEGSLLEQTNRLVVARQESHARKLGLPWGVSECAYNARDLEFTYQYSSFGIPGLGLKRGLSENAVIAPYATALGAMIDPRSAVANFADIARLGGLGAYGFYEALDFTPARLPENADLAVVRSFMAHHQGMTIVAIGNLLHGGRMRARFHAEPMIQATELLLQERMPRDVAVAHPRAEEVHVAPTDIVPEGPVVRRLKLPAGSPPSTHILSNGRYSVMLTSAGSGYSRWRDLAVTRWREDATRDDWGAWVFLRDVRSGAVWSAGHQPVGAAPDAYDVTFGEDRAEFVRRDGTLQTTLEVIVSAEDDAEVRRVSVVNRGRREREIDITSYFELVLASASSDNAHPAFSKMFVQTEYIEEVGAILATRRRRSPDEPEVWAAHLAVVEGNVTADRQVETDRARFVGRGRTIGEAGAVFSGDRLSNTTGTVLDPVVAIRTRVAIPAGEAARIAYWTMVASSREELLDLIDKHHDRNAFERAKTLAWTQARVQLGHLGVKIGDAADFQAMASHILYAGRSLRASPETMASGAGGQPGLWPYGISGDVPIVLVLVDDVEDMANVRQLLHAHEYWRMKGLAVDLVVLNERRSSYVQDLQIAIESAVRGVRAKPNPAEAAAQGAIFTLRADLLSPDGRALLQSVARVVLVARRGGIAEHLARIPQNVPVAKAKPRRLPDPVPHSPRVPPELEFFNGLGGFAANGREYVTVMGPGVTTPAPWLNVIANQGFGFQVSAEGSGFTWASNSRENQLTPWSNDPVCDPPGEAIYVRDEQTGEFWTPTAQPIRDAGTYVARHGRGYSRFEHEAHGIGLELLQFVPLEDPVKISRLTIRNLSDRARTLSVTSYAEWVLGKARESSAPFIVTEVDAVTGAMLARNPWSTAFDKHVAFADLGGRQTAWSGDRSRFIGHDGRLSCPAALLAGGSLSGMVGAGLDPCAVLQGELGLPPGGSVEIVILLGQAATVEEARVIVGRYRNADLDHELATVEAYWDGILGAVQVKTPDRAMDIMLNGWLLYQALACRIWARSAFYQASGAYGFRDQLQDGMALTFARPDLTRAHLLRVAGRQFVEGDVQHWWLPSSGAGVRTRISDDRAWLAFGVATYVEVSGDEAILEEIVPFLDGPALQPGAHDNFFQPETAEESGSLFEHCARALDQALSLVGEDGMPLIGTGDWNDGMNRVGEGGRGQSVWLGWLLIRTVALFAPHAAQRDPGRAGRWGSQAEALRAAIERYGWDGDWYRRGTFDDGTPLGSATSEECRIDSIAQSWAMLSGAADPKRAQRAMASVETHLVRPADGIVLLFTPPFDKTPLDPGYIKGYPPGLRENGGQYSHAAMWAIMAFAGLGQGDEAAALFSLLNPINHARTPSEAARYKVEPYVVAADVYSVAPHVGRGGWTWYTGAAGWMYRAGIEAILGLRQRGDVLLVNPCIPSAWPAFEMTLRHGATRYRIFVDNPHGAGRGIGEARLDGVPIPVSGAGLQVPLDGCSAHILKIVLGVGTNRREAAEAAGWSDRT